MNCLIHGPHPHTHTDQPSSRVWCTVCPLCMDEAIDVPVRSAAIDSVSRETDRQYPR